MVTLEKVELDFNAFHSSNKHSCGEILSRQHRLSHLEQARFPIFGNVVSEDDVAEALVFLREAILEKATLVQNYSASIVNVQILADAPNHWRNRGVAAPNNLMCSDDGDDKFAYRALD